LLNRDASPSLCILPNQETPQKTLNRHIGYGRHYHHDANSLCLRRPCMRSSTGVENLSD
jgi:hypothetical protein